MLLEEPDCGRLRQGDILVDVPFPLVSTADLRFLGLDRPLLIPQMLMGLNVEQVDVARIRRVEAVPQVEADNVHLHPDGAIHVPEILEILYLYKVSAYQLWASCVP
jgi:hypothetical protein